MIGITGADGFIGSYLVRELSQNNEAFVKFDGDLNDRDAIRSFFEIESIDTLVHLAGVFANDIDLLLRVNCLATGNLLQIGSQYGVKKIIFSSTGAVYGNTVEAGSKESNPTAPNTLYGLSKKVAEDIIFYHDIEDGLSYAILRFPHVYGYGNTKGVIYNFIHDIATKGAVTIYGDGEQSRDFLHISDAVQALMKAIGYGRSGVFNISSSARMSLNQVIQLLKEKYNFTVNYVEQPDNKLERLHLDFSKAEKVLDYCPVINKLEL